MRTIRRARTLSSTGSTGSTGSIKLIPLLGMVTIVALALACTSKAGPPPPKNEISAWLEKPDALVLDVRSAGEFDSGHVPGAANVPVRSLRNAGDLLGKNKARPIVVHCAVGVRSARAAVILADMGYSNVLDAKTPSAVSDALGVPLQ